MRIRVFEDDEKRVCTKLEVFIPDDDDTTREATVTRAIINGLNKLLSPHAESTDIMVRDRPDGKGRRWV
jgi:hypothetical protein